MRKGQEQRRCRKVPDTDEGSVAAKAFWQITMVYPGEHMRSILDIPTTCWCLT